LFDTAGDYHAFEDCLIEARAVVPLRLLAYCLMPNHFHLVVWPMEDGQMSEFMRLATGTHGKRWHACRGTAGTGAVYQNRFKAFPVQGDSHFLTVCRYVERNALRAGLVKRAEDWRWSSIHKNGHRLPLDPWPILQPPNWLDLVNADITASEVERVRRSIRRSRPFGDPRWEQSMSEQLGLAASVAPIGRPKTTPGVVLRKS
jgi:putative transposase